MRGKRTWSGLRSPFSLYSAACALVVFSSSTTSGLRLGTLFTAVAGPRSIFIDRERVQGDREKFDQPCEPANTISSHCRRTFTHTLATESAGSPNEDRRLIFEDNGTSILIFGYHLCRYGCSLALIKDFDDPVPQREPTSNDPTCNRNHRESPTYRASLTNCPFVGIGALIERNCSPCRSLA